MTIIIIINISGIFSYLFFHVSTTSPGVLFLWDSIWNCQGFKPYPNVLTEDPAWQHQQQIMTFKIINKGELLIDPR